MPSRKLCHHEVSYGHASLVYTSLLWFFVLPFVTWFGRHFWKKLHSELGDKEKDPVMIRAVEVYIVATTAIVWLSAYNNPLAPLLQMFTAANLTMCSTVAFLILIAYIVAYISFQRVLLRRLQLAFAHTSHPLSAAERKAFDVIHCIIPPPFIGALLYQRCIHACFVKAHFYELPNSYFACETTKRMQYTIVIIFGFFPIICGNLALVWMFVWRLKAVFLESVRNSVVNSESLSRQRNGGVDTISDSPPRKIRVIVLALDKMRKSTVVAIFSVVSTIVPFITAFINFHAHAAAIDLLVNEVLIYCLFSFGDGLYDTLLGFCHFTVDCCLPKHARDIEYDAYQKQVGRVAASNP